ncbi:lipopolysaccharide biosynthesis protein [Zobellella denitrificans]
MEVSHFARFVNIGLRGVTLVSKFVLIFFLAGFLEPKDLGLYGLITVTIAYAIYPLGFDFYTYTTRELLNCERSEWGGLLKDQAILHLALYAVVLPLLLIVFSLELLPWYLAGWFFVLLVLEHLNQEMMRLLIAISEQLTASWVLFLRSGCWALGITAWMFFDSSIRSLESVLAAWALGSMLALILSIYRLKCLNLSGWSKNINWSWIVKGLTVAVPFLVATLAIRAVFTIDRYWFEALQGLELLGAYVLFMSISNTLMSFLDAGVFSFSYPSLIAAHNRGDVRQFRVCLRRLFWQTMGLTAAFVVVAWFVIEPLLSMLDKPFYIEQLFLFPWVLTVMVLYAIGMVPHYALYAQGLDKPIIYSHLSTVIVFVPTTWLFSLQLPDKAVLLGMMVTLVILLLWKTWAFYRLTPRRYYSPLTANLH